MRFEKVSLDQYLKDVKGDTYRMSTGHQFNICDDIIYGHASVSGAFKELDQSTPESIYDSIKLPKRATKKSAGYDFFAPYSFSLAPGESIKIATGIRVLLDDDKVLICAPRSGLGFKARVQLDNTIGVIDADYSGSSNEGHIMLKLTNDSREGKSVVVNKGEGMMQSMILQYFKVEDDDVDTVRDGGFGSTTKKEEK